MFDIESLQTYIESVSYLAISIAVGLSVVLSALIVLTYDLTTSVFEKDKHFLQSMAMISIVATMVMQAVGDSLARGLGLLGALAIIRFRTSLRDPRNMTFMFASLAVGISCGVFGFTIAIIGTFAFCLLAIILKYSPYDSNTDLVGELKFGLVIDQGSIKSVESALKKITKEFVLKDVRFKKMNSAPKATEIKDDQIEETQIGNVQIEEIEPIQIPIREYTYDIVLKGLQEDLSLIESLQMKEGMHNVRVRFSKKPIQL